MHISRPVKSQQQQPRSSNDSHHAKPVTSINDIWVPPAEPDPGPLPGTTTNVCHTQLHLTQLVADGNACAWS